MKNSVNFAKLWDRLKAEAEIAEDERMKAVLMNHEKRKEYICRKLGVVSDADINRISIELKTKK
jgi:hypothetical protein